MSRLCTNVQVCVKESTVNSAHFFLFLSLLLPELVTCRMSGEKLLVLLTWPHHFYFLFLTVAMGFSSRPVSEHCVVWDTVYIGGSITLRMLRFFAGILLLMSKIHRHAERLRKPMRATIWSLISGICLCHSRLFLVLRQTPFLCCFCQGFSYFFATAAIVFSELEIISILEPSLLIIAPKYLDCWFFIIVVQHEFLCFLRALRAFNSTESACAVIQTLANLNKHCLLQSKWLHSSLSLCISLFCRRILALAMMH